jgi:hypothetical protein
MNRANVSNPCTVRRDTNLEATLVAKYVVMEPLLNERTRRLWAAAESIAIGFGGDAIVSSATGLARQTIRNGRHELAQGITTSRIRQPWAGRPGIEDTQPGITEALDLLVEPLTRGARCRRCGGRARAPRSSPAP